MERPDYEKNPQALFRARFIMGLEGTNLREFLFVSFYVGEENFFLARTIL